MFNGFRYSIDSALESYRILGKRLSNVKSELLKSESFYQGENFEVFVENQLFPEEKYLLIRRTDTHERNKRRYAESSGEPDFVFKCLKTGKQFAVEAKYRSRLMHDGRLHWACVTLFREASGSFNGLEDL